MHGRWVWVYSEEAELQELAETSEDEGVGTWLEHDESPATAKTASHTLNSSHGTGDVDVRQTASRLACGIAAPSKLLSTQAAEAEAAASTSLPKTMRLQTQHSKKVVSFAPEVKQSVSEDLSSLTPGDIMGFFTSGKNERLLVAVIVRPVQM